jgi:cysteine desulfurase/selenocysteine lyase
MSFNVNKIRLDFPMLRKEMNGKKFIYFDNAATTHKPASVIASMTKFYEEDYATVHRAVYEFATNATEAYSEVRRLVAKFIHASSEDEIIFTKGATEAINLVAYSYGREFVRRGDEVLITEMEHHANIVPWQLLCEEVGAKLVVVPVNAAGEINMELFEEKLHERTKIVAVAHMSNVLGTINPIEEIVRLSHAKGAVVFVDGAQAAPHISIDLAKLKADFYTFSGHKIYGPMGVGVLYGRFDLLEKMRPFHGGGDVIKEVTFPKTIFQSPPLKFEAGTPLVASVIGLGAAIEYLNAIGIEQIRRHEESLLERATKALEAFSDIEIVGAAKEKGAILSFHIEGIHPLDFGTMIAFKGMAIRTGTMCAQPIVRHFGYHSLSRISFGLYNTVEEVDAFIQALSEVIQFLSPAKSF